MENFIRYVVLLLFIGLIFWKQILNIFKYFFVPQKIVLCGEIVEIKKTKVPNYFYRNYLDLDDRILRFNELNRFTTRYYVKVWIPVDDVYHTLEISYPLYKKCKIKAMSLDYFIILNCKKYSSSDELIVV